MFSDYTPGRFSAIHASISSWAAASAPSMPWPWVVQVEGRDMGVVVALKFRLVYGFEKYRVTHNDAPKKVL